MSSFVIRGCVDRCVAVADSGGDEDRTMSELYGQPPKLEPSSRWSESVVSSTGQVNNDAEASKDSTPRSRQDDDDLLTLIVARKRKSDNNSSSNGWQTSVNYERLATPNDDDVEEGRPLVSRHSGCRGHNSTDARGLRSPTACSTTDHCLAVIAFRLRLLCCCLFVCVAGAAVAAAELKAEQQEEQEARAGGHWSLPNRPSLFSIVRFPNEECFDSSNQSGTCYTAFECKLLGGQPSSPCAAGFGSCCIVSRTCHVTTREKVVYFKNPSYPSTDSDEKVCDLTVEMSDVNVCQVRLDFLDFQLDAPANGACQQDYMEISASGMPPQTVPRLCGLNRNQHREYRVRGRACESGADAVCCAECAAAQQLNRVRCVCVHLKGGSCCEEERVA